MKLINFAKTDNDIYKNVLAAFIEPIIKHLPENQSDISKGCICDAVNVIFFREWFHRQYLNNSVFLPHGIADKGYRNGNVVDMFDYICVSGPFWVEKMIREGVNPDKILMIGYPRMDTFFNGELVQRPYDASKKRVLWAPTHDGIPSVSTYPGLLGVLEKLPEDYEVTVSLHPANREDKMPTLQRLMDADIVVTSSGSMVYEAWALGKQVVFPDYLVKESLIESDTFEAQIYKENIGLHATSEEHLLELVQSGIYQPLDSQVTEFIEGIFPKELRGVSGKTCANHLLKIANNEKPNQMLNKIDKLYRHDPLWQMSPSERASTLHLISNLPNKNCAIEIGSYKGGFLRVLSSYFAKVYSCDIDHSQLDCYHIHEYTNVEFVEGDSKQTIPNLIAYINEVAEEVSFVLIDGDHSYEGVLQDIKNVLEYVPTCETVILIHDSWYQPLRQAILDTDFESNPYVKHVEVDFVPGDLFDSPSEGRVFIGGLAMIILSPNKRQGDLAIKSSSRHMYNTLSELLSKQRESQ